MGEADHDVEPTGFGDPPHRLDQVGRTGVVGAERLLGQHNGLDPVRQGCDLVDIDSREIMSGFELASRLPPDEVSVNSLHPATYMPTKIVLDEIGHHVDSLAAGVTATRRLVADDDLANTTGHFFDRTQDTRANPQAYDTRARRELWQRSLELIDHPDVD